MATFFGIVLLGAIVTGMAYLVAVGVGRTSIPAWRRDEEYRERPVDRYVTVSLD